MTPEPRDLPGTVAPDAPLYLPPGDAPPVPFDETAAMPPGEVAALMAAGRVYATRLVVGGMPFGGRVLAGSPEEARAKADARGLGETVEGVVRPPPVPPAVELAIRRAQREGVLAGIAEAQRRAVLTTSATIPAEAAAIRGAYEREHGADEALRAWREPEPALPALPWRAAAIMGLLDARIGELEGQTRGSDRLSPGHPWAPDQ